MPVTTSLPVYRTADIRTIESSAAAAGASPSLMERAGLAAAQITRERLLGDRRSVVVIAGPGNNGGDGFVLARHLKQWWYRVNVLFTGDAAQLSDDARSAYDAWLQAGGTLTERLPDHQCDVVVDALFGIGLTRPLDGRHAELVEWINRHPAPVLSLDIPSGLTADTGAVLGHAVRAAFTVTFIALKPGLLTLEGPDHVGEWVVADLGLDVESLQPSMGRVMGEECLAHVLSPRLRNSHKGSFGSVGIVGGAAGMTGAALLAGRAALQLGAGRVYLGLLRKELSVDLTQPELMLREADETVEMQNLNCLVVGPGLGQSPPARSAVARALERDVPLVLDADALNLLGAHDALKDVCRTRRAATLLTPHPAEAARLLNSTTAAVQADRVHSALELALRYRASVALKGAGTVVATEDGHWSVNLTGNPGLASAGMGDVLSGICGALLAQSVEPHEALCAAVHLHGRAADVCAEVLGGWIGMTASEVTAAARSLMNDVVYGEPETDRISPAEDARNEDRGRS